MTNHPLQRRRWLAALALCAATLALHAQDLPGTQDHPLLKRFAGSSIVARDVQRFDTYRLPTGGFLKYDTDTRRREFRSELALEGAITRLWYEAPGATTSTELLRNYRNDLVASGFQVLYDATQDPRAGHWTNFLAPYGFSQIATSRSNYVFFAAPPDSVRFATFRRSGPDGDVYVSVTAVEWPRDDATYKARRGAYASVDVIEVAALRQDMVRVSAAEMGKAIEATGRVALYGLQFDSGRSTLKPESGPALLEIAQLLRANPGWKLRVVGHTDSEGRLDDNLALSQRRAQEIVATLVKQQGIAASRLSAHGVADLSPIASNANPAGRAKNRRVELVPQ